MNLVLNANVLIAVQVRFCEASFNSEMCYRVYVYAAASTVSTRACAYVVALRYL